MTDLRESLEQAIIKALKPGVTAVASLRTDEATLPRVVIEARNFSRRIAGTAIWDIEATLHVISPMDDGLTTHKEKVVTVMDKLGLGPDKNEAQAGAALTHPGVSFKALILEGIERELQDRELQDRVSLRAVAVPTS